MNQTKEELKAQIEFFKDYTKELEDEINDLLEDYNQAVIVNEEFVTIIEFLKSKFPEIDDALLEYSNKNIYLN